MHESFPPSLLECEERPSPATRRQLLMGAAATVGGAGLLGLPGVASAAADDPQTILNVTATVERLGVIVTTVGGERVALPAKVKRNAGAAARHELLHHRWLTRTAGAKPATSRIWVPNVVFSSPLALLSALEVGESNEVNGYLIGTTVFASRGNERLARIFAELVANESVHRAVVRDALDKVANDRAWAKYDQAESAPDAPNKGKKGFRRIEGLIAAYESAGFGFGKKGSLPGAFYDFDAVSKRTPDDPVVNTRSPR